MLREIVIAVVAASLALAGALAQAFLARMHTQADRRRELLIEAYSDYLSGLAQRIAILEAHSPRTEAATALLITGKQKITAYAPASVVMALAAFEHTSLKLSEPDAQSAMIALVTEMRRSVGVKSEGMENCIHAVLFGGTRFVS